MHHQSNSQQNIDMLEIDNCKLYFQGEDYWIRIKKPGNARLFYAIKICLVDFVYLPTAESIYNILPNVLGELALVCATKNKAPSRVLFRDSCP